MKRFGCDAERQSGKTRIRTAPGSFRNWSPRAGIHNSGGQGLRPRLRSKGLEESANFGNCNVKGPVPRAPGGFARPKGGGPDDPINHRLKRWPLPAPLLRHLCAYA